MTGPTDLLPATWDPPVDAAAVNVLLGELHAAGIPTFRDEPMGRHTTLGVGGPARCRVEPRDSAELAGTLRMIAAYDEADVPVLVLGRGSNLLVGDLGWDAVVLRLGAGFKWQHRDDLEVSAGAGLAMPALAAWTAAVGLSGLEFAAGIPATIGGSVRMNAGAHGGATGDRLVDVRVASTEVPEGHTLAAAELRLGYRRSDLPSRTVVTAARWRLSPAEPADIRRRLDDLRGWRRSTQPLRLRNCGSVFTNPEGDSAGRLVEAAGCKGLQVGGARVSDKHANFIVVETGTRARDVRSLIALVRARVLDAGGPLLEPEVRLVGSFDAGASAP